MLQGMCSLSWWLDVLTQRTIPEVACWKFAEEARVAQATVTRPREVRLGRPDESHISRAWFSWSSCAWRSRFASWRQWPNRWDDDETSALVSRISSSSDSGDSAESQTEIRQNSRGRHCIEGCSEAFEDGCHESWGLEGNSCISGFLSGALKPCELEKTVTCTSRVREVRRSPPFGASLGMGVTGGRSWPWWVFTAGPQLWSWAAWWLFWWYFSLALPVSLCFGFLATSVGMLFWRPQDRVFLDRI